MATFALQAQTGNKNIDQITGQNINDVAMKMQSFMSRKMRLTASKEQSFVHHTKNDVDVIYHYQKFNDPDKTIKLLFGTNPEGHDLIVTDVTISGDRDLIIEFFVKYWNTEINLDTNSEPLAESRYLNDKVELFNSNPRIIVSKF